MNRFLTSAKLRTAPSVRSLLQILDPLDTDRAVDTRHRLVWSLFASDQDSVSRDFLWRHDEGGFLILSSRPPADPNELFDLRTTPFKTRFDRGQKLRFRLRVNATICRTVSRDGRRFQSRHDIVQDAVLQASSTSPSSSKAALRRQLIPAVSKTWLEDLGLRSGFKLLGLSNSHYDTVQVYRPRGAPARFGVLDLDGSLELSDPACFALRHGEGFGRGKAFGFGLMLLMPE